MKCPRYDMAKAKPKPNVEMGSPEKPLGLHGKDSPIKDPIPLKPLAEKVSKVLFPHNDSLGVAQDKENQTAKEHENTFDESLEDSGYLSLYNSHFEEGVTRSQEKKSTFLMPLPPPTVTPKQSPRCEENIVSGCPAFLGIASTPADSYRRKPVTYSLSSTPLDHYDSTNLPIVKFQQAACQELAKSYSKNKRYDWSVISKVAEDHLLHQVIGGRMGLEFVDVFSSLLSKNMRIILANILALLGDMDLISCKKVSRTWRKIIREDSAALQRCRQAEKVLQESLSSVTLKSSGLTRDAVVSRMVLSCVQKVASPNTPSSATASSVSRRNATVQRNNQSNSQCSRFNEYLQAASTLKQHQSLRSCRQCGSPATHSPDAQRATCMRPSCQFDFCTRCQEAFHGSTPCRVVQCRSRFSPSGSSQSLLPGSAQSKRNIRRL
ncbi:F-box only protein 5 [Syngnathus scovelli]|uniref:F-box only protein 5 n=1 Tax=Syngnathus scovelli TaxID=161590 RepID=UPI0021104465|nr:F-box only protein 5 [Syngnathus scovelli]XP_049591892.1 F-box only protein 5 [Syngnathus scovelli]